MTMPASDRHKQRPEEHLTDAQLNELVDGTLSAQESDRAQTHLTSCAECDERYRTLLATVSALKTAPGVMPRRSFQLTPEQAKRPAPKATWLDRFSDWIVPGVPALRAATLAVALLLISVTAIDVVTNQSNDSENAGPAVMRQQQPTLPAAAQQPPLQESGDTGSGASTGGAPEPTEGAGGTLGPQQFHRPARPREPPAARWNRAMPRHRHKDISVDEETTSSDESEAPVAPAAPAAAMQPQTSAESTSELPALMAEAPPLASPAASPSAMASPAPSAAASSVPAAGNAGAKPARPVARKGHALPVAHCRVGLLMVLVWLLVSWFGRSRVGVGRDRRVTRNLFEPSHSFVSVVDPGSE